MRSFIGFSTDKQRTVRVPDGFFEDVLPQITSMLEMKVTLYLFWRLARGAKQGVAPKMVSLAELGEDDGLRSALSRIKGPRPFDEALREGLELCVARGTVLRLRVRDEGPGSGGRPSGSPVRTAKATTVSPTAGATNPTDPSGLTTGRAAVSRTVPSGRATRTRFCATAGEGNATNVAATTATAIASMSNRRIVSGISWIRYRACAT